MRWCPCPSWNWDSPCGHFCLSRAARAAWVLCFCVSQHRLFWIQKHDIFHESLLVHRTCRMSHFADVRVVSSLILGRCGPSLYLFDPHLRPSQSDYFCLSGIISAICKGSPNFSASGSLNRDSKGSKRLTLESSDIPICSTPWKICGCLLFLCCCSYERSACSEGSELSN